MSFSNISRRDFLKFCSVLAGVIGAGEAAGPEVARALAGLKERPSVIWSSYMVCSGCAVNLLQSRTPSVAQLVLQDISLDYQEVVMAAPGNEAEELYRQALDRGDFLWIVEGAIAGKVPKAMTIRGEPSTTIASRTYQKAQHVIAIGSCSSYGNIQAAAPNPTGAVGLRDYLESKGEYSPSKPVINSPRCPGNAEDTLAIIAYILYYGSSPALDSINRPMFLFGQTVHDNCERRGHFEAGEFVEVFGDKNTAKQFCLLKVGCKGPVTYAPCPRTRWNDHISWPVRSGPCIGCSEPDFWDKMTPFYEQEESTYSPVGGVSPTTIGIALAGATALGIGAHFIGQAATGRLGRGGPMENEPHGTRQADAKLEGYKADDPLKQTGMPPKQEPPQASQPTRATRRDDTQIDEIAKALRPDDREGKDV